MPLNRFNSLSLRLLALGWLSTLPLAAQVPVAPMEIPRAQFLNATGQPLAAGCINFFAAGTSTPQAIYADNTGIAQLSNPLTLDSAGEASVWMSNVAYRIVANTGVVGQPCSSALGTQLWVEDNKNIFAILTSGFNYIVASGTVDPSGSAGMLAYRSDIPCFRGFTTIWDCFATLAGVQTLTNKTLVNPVISSSSGAVLSSPNINGTVVTGSPATYLVMANDLVTGTTLNKLAKINPAGLAGFAILPLITDTGGMTGIVVAGAGNTGNATIQQNGSTSCIFDNAVTSGDYAQISPTVAGDCHDSGIAYPSGGQVLGRVLATNVAAGTYPIDLFGPEIKAGNQGATTGCTNFTPVTVTNNNTQQNLMSCSIAANTLAQGSLLEVNLQGIESTASGQNTIYSISLGGGTACQVQPSQGVAANQPWNIVAKFFVLTSGAGGTANWSCEFFSSPAGGTAGGLVGAIGAPTISVNTTISNTLQITEQMSIANAGNIVVQQGLKAVIF